MNNLALPVSQTVYRDGVFPVSISQSLTDKLLGEAKARTAYHRLSGLSYAPDTHFDVWILPSDSALYALVKQHIDGMLNVDADVIRIHRMSDADTIERHVDSGYPDRDTLVFRLDNHDDPRFIINDSAVPESQGAGYYMPEGTPHAVSSGLTERYSLTIWVKP